MRKELPAKYVAFLHEYTELCRKHGLMVLSNGEPVVVGDADEDLWGIEQRTKEEWLND